MPKARAGLTARELAVPGANFAANPTGFAPHVGTCLRNAGL